MTKNKLLFWLLPTHTTHQPSHPTFLFVLKKCVPKEGEWGNENWQRLLLWRRAMGKIYVLCNAQDKYSFLLFCFTLSISSILCSSFIYGKTNLYINSNIWRVRNINHFIRSTLLQREPFPHQGLINIIITIIVGLLVRVWDFVYIFWLWGW